MLSKTDLTNRPLQAWNEDGLPEIFTAFYCALIAAAYTVPLGPQSVLRGFRGLVLALFAFSSLWILRRVKAKMTAPRVGYVEPAMFTRGSVIWGSLTAIAITAFVVVTSFRFPRTTETVAMPALSILIAIGGIVTALGTSTARFLAISLVPIAFGIWALQSGADLRAIPWLFLWWGVAMGLSGTLTFIRFRKLHPIRTEPAS